MSSETKHHPFIETKKMKRMISRIGLAITFAFVGNGLSSSAHAQDSIQEFESPDEVLEQSSTAASQPLYLELFQDTLSHGFNQHDEKYAQITMPGGNSSFYRAGCGIFAYTHIRRLVEGLETLPEDLAPVYFPDSDIAIPMATVASQLREQGYEVEPARIHDDETLLRLLSEEGWDAALVSRFESEDDQYGHIFVLTLDENGALREINSDYKPEYDSPERWQSINGVYLVRLP